MTRTSKFEQIVRGMNSVSEPSLLKRVSVCEASLTAPSCGIRRS